MPFYRPLLAENPVYVWLKKSVAEYVVAIFSEYEEYLNVDGTIYMKMLMLKVIYGCVEDQT